MALLRAHASHRDTLIPEQYHCGKLEAGCNLQRLDPFFNKLEGRVVGDVVDEEENIGLREWSMDVHPFIR